MAGHDVKDTKLAGSGDQGDIMRCFVCDSKDYRAVDCKNTEIGMKTLELKNGEKSKCSTELALKRRIRITLSVMSGKIGDKNVVLWDSGCKEVIVKRELEDKANFTREVCHMMTFERIMKRAHIPCIKVDTPYYTRNVDLMCMKNSVFDLIIENVPGARKPNYPNPE